jgi:hypothetical protein
MKTKLLLLTVLTSIFAAQAQDRTSINAMNSEISDNLDLRAVADIFGDSKNIQDFERRLNDPTLQISNLDLNNDDEVDYLRVIETVEKRTHVIIIQAVLEQDVYQDIATIDVEKDKYNNVHVQVVGDVYMYGQNYIYEPVYYTTPFIYASFWVSNYRPYYSTWSWNYYPSYYYSWNPYPVFRYRNNIHLSLNIHNNYNYVNYRRSNRAEYLHYSRRSNGYERQHPEYAFSRRNASVANRYELDQRRDSRNVRANNQAGYANRSNASQRESVQNRTRSNRENAPQRTASQRDYTPNRSNSNRENAPQRTASQRDYTPNRSNSNRENVPQQTASQRNYAQNRATSPQGTEMQRNNSQNRANSSREAAPQRVQSQRDNSQNRSSSARENSSQRTESSRENGGSRGNARRS